MKKLPNVVKWIIILAALAAMGWMMWAVNDRASRVEMPAPDNTFGIYRRFQPVNHLEWPQHCGQKRCSIEKAKAGTTTRSSRL